MRGFVRDSFLELFRSKTIFLFGAFTVLGLLLAFGSPSIDFPFPNDDTGTGSDNGGSSTRASILIKVVETSTGFLVFLAVMASASVLPRMLEKGRVDFYLSKPVSRGSILLNKMAGIWLSYGVVIIVSSILIYSVAAAIHGAFDQRILIVFAAQLIVFFVWITITSTAAVVTGSQAFAIMSAFIIWVFQSILSAHEAIADNLPSEWMGTIVNFLYYVFPKTSQLSDQAILMATGLPYEMWMPLVTTLGFAAILMLASFVIFQRKNY